MLRLKAPPRWRFVPRPAGGWLLRRGARGERTIPLAESPFVVGRALDCGLILPDSPELRRSTSRWHCHIAARGGALVVADGSLAEVPRLGRPKPSSSGTWRNGRRLGEPEALSPGDRLRVGPWEFLVEAAPAPALAWPAPRAGGDARFGELERWEEGEVVAGIYEVRGSLGVGGMGAVYRVRHKGWDIDLAVKRPTPRVLEAAGGAERFVREAETWVNLPLHPHLVTAYYVRTLGGSPAIFAECVEGGDLRRWLEEGRAADAAAGLDVAIQVCWGMAAAHARGLVHRDLKPANILMGPGGEAKVTDFGLAKRAREEDLPRGEAPAAEAPPTLTRLGAAVGTPPYMPPEQWRGEAVGPAADVYAFGAVLYELLCRRPPFALAPELAEAMGAVKLAEFRRLHLKEPPPDPEALNPALPRPLAALMRRCLAKEPAERPGGFAALAEELAGYYREVSGRDYGRRDPGALESRAVELNNRALSMLDLGDEKGARRLLDKALAADPHHPEATYNQVILRWRAGEIDDTAAVKRMEEALAARLESGTAAHLLGLVQLRRGDARAAAGVLAGARGRMGVEGLLALGDARMALGRPDEAEADYAEARAAAPDSPEAERRLVAALAAQGKREEAAEVWSGEDYAAALAGLEFPHMRALRALEGHNGYIQCVAAVPDGAHAVTAGLDRAMRLWDLRTGRCVRILGGLENTPFLLVTPDGRFVLAQGIGGDISFWDLATGECARRVEGHARNVSALALTPDGRRGVSGDEGGTVVRWDFTAGSPPGVAGLEELPGAGRVRALAMTPDGRRVLAGGDEDGGIRVWDGRAPAAALRGHRKTVVSLAVTRDGARAVSASWDDTLRVWDLARGECLRVLEGHSVATAVALSPDGRRVLSGGMDKTVRLWDLDSGSCLRTFSGHEGSVYAVAFSPDGRALSGGSDKVLRLWSVAPRLPPLAPAFAHVVSSDEAAALERRVALLREGVARDAQAGDWSRADAALREARALPGYAKDPALLALTDRVALKGVRALLASHWVQRTLSGHAGPVAAVAVSPDEHLALSGGTDGAVRLWGLDSGKLLCLLGGHAGAAGALAFAGARGLSAGEDGALRVWDVEARRLKAAWEGHRGRINAVAAAPDGRQAVTAGEDGAVRVWDIVAGRCARVFEGHRGAVKAAAVSPDGAVAASAGDDGVVRLWDLAGGGCLRVLKGHDYSVHGLAFAPDGRTLLSGGGDRTVRLWDLSDGSCRRVWERGAPVRRVDALPEGRHALAVLRGATSFAVWATAGDGGGSSLDGHAKPVVCAAPASSGRFLVSGGEDGLILVWRLDWEHAFPPVDEAALAAALEVFLEAHAGRWGEPDWKALFHELGLRGFGGLPAEVLRERLEALTARYPAERRAWLGRRYGAELG